MKNSKTERPVSRFPNIYRIITEKIRYFLGLRLIKYSLFGIIIAVLLIMSIQTGLSLSKNYQIFKQREAERDKVLVQLKTWQSIGEKYPNYKDAFLQIAILEYRLKDLTNARYYLNKALLLDPNYNEALSFGKRLKNF